MGNFRSVVAATILCSLTYFGSVPSIYADSSDAYITASRPTSDTPAVKAKVASLLADIPFSIRDLVFTHGCRIVIVPITSEYMGAGYSERPRGYVRGGGYDNVAGLFMPGKNELVVSERVSYFNGAPRLSARLPEVIHHEFGHAYDQYLGKSLNSQPLHWAASELPGFVDCHTKEAQRLSNTQRERLNYFCQPGADGSSETFAELFCVQVTPANQLTPRQKELAAAFPQTEALVKAAMASPSAIQRWVEQ